jgi:hypothetical protein
MNDVPAEHIPTDACYRCGYDLRGVADEQPCPECGLVAINSRRPSEELHHTRPGWLARLSWGLRLIVLAGIALVATPVVGLLIEQWAKFPTLGRMRGRPITTSLVLWRHAEWVCADVAAMSLLAGVFLLTAPEGYEVADRADAGLRRWLRIAVAPAVVASLLAHVLTQFDIATVAQTGVRQAAEMDLWWAIGFLLTVGLCPLPILLGLRLRSIARRARHTPLAEDSVIVGVGNSVTLLYAPLVYVIYENAQKWGLGDYWTSRSNVSAALLILLYLASIVFALWSVYLLIRFSIAFANASKALRRRWKVNDQALLVG